MGCSLYHEEQFSPETHICEQEARLSFSHFPATQIDLFIRKVASQEVLNRRQFEAVLEEFRTIRAGSSEYRMEYLYMTSMLLNRGLCDRNEIIVAACLFGQGTVEERYRVLFEIGDLDFEGFITYQDAVNIARIMVKVAIESVPMLVNFDVLKKKENVEMKAYIKMLKRASEATVFCILKEIFPDEKGICSLSVVFERLKDSKTAEFMTTTGIRSAAKQWVAEVQSKARVSAQKKSIQRSHTKLH